MYTTKSFILVNGFGRIKGQFSTKSQAEEAKKAAYKAGSRILYITKVELSFVK